MTNPLREACRQVLLTALRENGGMIVLSGRMREELSNRGLTKGDLAVTVHRSIFAGEVELSAEDGRMTLTLATPQKGEPGA